MATSRLPNGLSLDGPAARFANLGVPIPINWQVYFNDFHAYSADDWLETVVDTDTDAANARTIDATAGGVLNILLDNNAADSTNLQLGGTGAEPFVLAPGKQWYFGAKFSSTDVDKNFLAISLCTTDTDLQGGLPNDNVTIRVDGTDANIDVVLEKDNTATTEAAVGTVSDYAEGTNDLTEVVLYGNGKGSVEVWVDGVKVTTLADTNVPDDEQLALHIEIHNTDAAADAMAVDWVLVAVER